MSKVSSLDGAPCDAMLQINGIIFVLYGRLGYA